MPSGAELGAGASFGTVALNSVDDGLVGGLATIV